MNSKWPSETYGPRRAFRWFAVGLAVFVVLLAGWYFFNPRDTAAAAYTAGYELGQDDAAQGQPSASESEVNDIATSRASGDRKVFVTQFKAGYEAGFKEKRKSMPEMKSTKDQK